jgi:DNA-binding response OmpR family regulator
VEALRNGATDYLLKPLKPQALIERAQTTIANQQKENRKREIPQIEAAGGTQEPSTVKPVHCKLRTNADHSKARCACADLHKRCLVVTNKPSIFPILVSLFACAGTPFPDVVNYQTLVAEAQGYQTDAREAQELTKWHIHQLRQAIEQDAHAPSILINVRGTGYRLVAD